MSQGRAKSEAPNGETESAETAKQAVRERAGCWRCAAKNGAPHYPRRKGRLLAVASRKRAGRGGGLRLSQGFRVLCALCDGWRRVNSRAAQSAPRRAFRPRRMQAREDFAPLQSAPKEAGVLSPSELAVLEAWRAERRKERERPRPAPLEDWEEPPDMEPVSEEAYRVDPYKDPFRDYTYFLQHQKEQEARAQAGDPAREEAAKAPEKTSTADRAAESAGKSEGLLRPGKKNVDPPPGPRIIGL